MAAPTWSLLTSGSTATNASSFTTASVTLTAGRLYLLAVTTDGVNTSDRQVPTSVTHATGTFTLVDSQNVDAYVTQSLWRLIPSSTATGVVTIGHTGVTQDIEIWSLTEWTGFDSTTPLGTVAKSLGTASTTSSVTATTAVSAEPSRLAVHSWVQDTIGTAATGAPASGWTEVSDNPQNESGFSVSMQVQARSSDASAASVTWSSASSSHGSMVVEVRSIPASTGPLFDSAIFSDPPFDVGAGGGSSASVSGTTLTATASLLAGSVTASSQASGITLTATASLIPGSASAASGASVSGQTITASASLITGTVAADSQVSGTTLTATASLLPGSASGSSTGTVNGQTLTATASLAAGSLSATSQVTGQTLTIAASVASIGAVTASSTMAGQTLTVTASLLAGNATADTSATANGQALTTTVFFFAGFADNGASSGPRDRARKIFPRKFK